MSHSLMYTFYFFNGMYLYLYKSVQLEYTMFSVFYRRTGNFCGHEIFAIFTVGLHEIIIVIYM